jgi:hypothetical protein
MRSRFLGLVIVSDFHTIEACSSLDLTGAKYSIKRLSVIEKENLNVQIKPNNFIAHEKKNHD